MDVSEVRHICKDRTVWKSIYSTCLSFREIGERGGRRDKHTRWALGRAERAARAVSARSLCAVHHCNILSQGRFPGLYKLPPRKPAPRISCTDASENEFLAVCGQNDGQHFDDQASLLQHEFHKRQSEYNCDGCTFFCSPRHAKGVGKEEKNSLRAVRAPGHTGAAITTWKCRRRVTALQVPFKQQTPRYRKSPVQYGLKLQKEVPGGAGSAPE
ncbi:hypothetical protein EVAR_51716_1 [Eumeta japonica]|uniref:Uncharacterized protein n=1 Tax=Eumeta variegata TaxID=151549 RepID=A0A4C1XJU3_EUMVA|nr:hypothetical protein EVAR_51716_1 [Eumeta japonica]